MQGMNMQDMQILELDSFEVPFPMSQADQEKYCRRFLTLLIPSDSDSHQGGSGRVDKVRNPEGEVFAMKRIARMPRAGMSEQRYRRQLEAQEAAFRKEFENQQRLSGMKGFPKLYGYGMAEGEPLIVMEWIEGKTVGKARELRVADPQGTCVPPLLVAQLGAELYELISRFEYLDDSFAHRDISSNNIMLRTDRISIEEQLKHDKLDLCLIDFGSATMLSHLDDPSFTVMAGVLRKATPEYAPPEMLTNDLPNLEKLRQSSLIDVYAIGSVLYELMCGEAPYRLAKLAADPASYYRYKLEHAVPLPTSLHAGMTSVSSIQNEPRLLKVLDRALEQGNFDQAKFLDAVNVVDQQLGHILMQSIEVEQANRAEAWEMKDMLGRYVKNYEENVMRRYNGQKLLPFRDVDSIPQRPRRVVQLGQVSTPGPTTILRPAGMPVQQPSGAMVAVVPGVQPGIAPIAPGSTASFRAQPEEPASITLPAVLTGAAVLLLSVLFAMGAHGQPGTLSLLGKEFSGNVPFVVCLLGCLVPTAVSMPFYWLAADRGQKLLSGVAAMTVVGAVVWWLIHITKWVAPAVEPMWSLVLAMILCISAVGAWTMINMKEG